MENVYFFTAVGCSTIYLKDCNIRIESCAVLALSRLLRRGINQRDCSPLDFAKLSLASLGVAISDIKHGYCEPTGEAVPK